MVSKCYRFVDLEVIRLGVFLPLSRRILIVDDDPDITNLLEIYLNDEGYDVDVAASEREMQAHLLRRSFDLILLDILLPDGDGFDITRRLRETSDTAIILISRKNTDIDQIVGLELGADDYVVKPLEPRSLLARIKSVLRRYKAVGPGELEQIQPKEADREICETIVDIADWQLDTSTYRLTRKDGKQHVLSANEATLLAYLVRHDGQVLTRNDLMQVIAGREWEYMDRSIDIMIVRLRKKIEANPSQPKLIQTVRGVGYIYQVPKTEDEENDLNTSQPHDDP
ncbi:response regulator [Thalassospira mesophila]|uniref:response regulator n=1 Tax=Thalassospira mesophila TaxID=1293891 RepID=UPI000A200D6E|nr:response regulator [Thalassospira mesophila]